MSSNININNIVHVYESQKKILYGKEHEGILEKAIIDVKQDIVISSLSITNVIDSNLLTLIEKKFKEGIVFNFIYYEQANPKSELSMKNLTYLSYLGNKFNFYGKINLLGNTKKFSEHSKVLIVDNSYMWCGSCNWLSNKWFDQRDITSLCTDCDEIKNLRNKIFN